MTWNIAAFTHRSQERNSNEDAVVVASHILTGDMTDPFVTAIDHGPCLLVSDGLGGHADGAVASRTVARFMVDRATQLIDQDAARATIEACNQALYASMDDTNLGMGATLAGALLDHERLLTFNLGDSSTYLFSDKRLVQLSTDDRAFDDNGRRSHVLTQSLGGSPFPTSVHPHVAADAPLSPGEMLLICSDGLTDMISIMAIHQILASSTSPVHAVRKLAASAFRAGARDNISVIVAKR